MVLGMALFGPVAAAATRRVREDFQPTWGMFGGMKVLTMEPYAFAPQRDLVYLPDQGVIERPHWGLIADLANLLQARTHVILGFGNEEDPEPEINVSSLPEPQQAQVYNQLVASWPASTMSRAKPGDIVLAGDGEGAYLATYLVEHAEVLNPKPDFVFEIPEFMKIPFLPKTAEAKRQISKQVWGDE